MKMHNNKKSKALLFVVSLFIHLSTIGSEVKLNPQTSLEDKTYTEQGLEHWYRGDFVTAIEVLIKADAEGDIQGTIALSQLYHFSSEFELALPLLLKAEAAEHQESMLVLIEYFERGQGMEKPDIKRAGLILKKLVMMKYKPAMMIEAEAIGQGRLGFDTDIQHSNQSILKLAEANYLPAIQKIYNSYLRGAPGITSDREQARYWRQKFIEVEQLNNEVIKREEY